MWFLFIGHALTPALQAATLGELLRMIPGLSATEFAAIVATGSAEIEFHNVAAETASAALEDDRFSASKFEGVES